MNVLKQEDLALGYYTRIKTRILEVRYDKEERRGEVE